MVIYGDYHDINNEVKYTDVDYKVFTDAARHVSMGESPYERHTYRYTPVLAWMLLRNVSTVLPANTSTKQLNPAMSVLTALLARGRRLLAWMLL